jgi:VanZ family protein|tara:strand:+ start:237 stop:632 length:396 start_codon:yes stop_codon:yes gene_type:complete
MINFFSKYKFIFYLSNFILLVLYLFPGSLLGCYLYNDCQLQPQLTKDFLVSTNHLYAFSLLSVIGLFTYNNSNKLNLLNIYLVLLSIVLEISHLFIPERGFELSDLFGNLLGVSIVLTINFFYRKYENYKN